MKKAVCLLSGGMDSAVTLYFAAEGYEPVALSFDYGQRHLRKRNQPGACARAQQSIT